MTQPAWTPPDREAMTAYIMEAAKKRGIDPEVAVAVARSEGLNADPSDGWQSNVVKNGQRERSYGPFQLYMDGGLGNEFMSSTGFDPRDPKTWMHQVDFALDHASKNGWGAWYGARDTGIGNMAGIGNNPGLSFPASVPTATGTGFIPGGVVQPGDPTGILTPPTTWQEAAADAGGILGGAFAAPEAPQIAPMQVSSIAPVARENPYIDFFRTLR